MKRLILIVLSLIPLKSIADYGMPEHSEVIAEGSQSLTYYTENPNMKDTKWNTCTIIATENDKNNSYLKLTFATFEPLNGMKLHSEDMTKGATEGPSELRQLDIEFQISGQDVLKTNAMGFERDGKFDDTYSVGIIYEPGMNDDVEIMAIDGIKVRKLRFYYDQEAVTSYNKCVDMLKSQPVE